jgi:hypothetical protein
VAEERFTDGDRALRRWALALRRGHVARVLHFVPIGRRPPDDRATRRAHAVIGWHEFCMLLDRRFADFSVPQHETVRRGGSVLGPPVPTSDPPCRPRRGRAMVPAAAEGEHMAMLLDSLRTAGLVS